MNASQSVCSHSDDISNLAVLDSEQFCEIKELFEEEFEPLMHTYMKDSQRYVHELQTALANNDNASGFESAHALKGASINVGAIKLNKLCYQMQEACRDNLITENAELLLLIEKQVELVNKEISQHLSD